MANTKIPSELSSTPSISDSGNATAITIDSSERVGIKKSPTKELDVAGTIKAVGATNNNTMEVFGAETSNQSFGLLVNAGTSSSDYSALFRDEDANTVLKIQGDGNVGIGTASPNAYSNVTTLTINGGVQGRLDVEYGGTHGGSFLAVSGETQVKAVGASNVMTFEVNNAERMRILTSGGITFNGDTAAANALDDYEEGTWTPVLTGSSTAGSFTMSSQAGIYTKIGGMVNVQWLIVVTGVTTQPTGNVNITGLPFSYSRTGGTAYMPVGVIGYNDVFNVEINKAYANGSQLTLIPNGVTQSNSNWSSVTLSTGYFSGSVWYAA